MKNPIIIYSHLNLQFKEIYHLLLNNPHHLLKTRWEDKKASNLTYKIMLPIISKTQTPIMILYNSIHLNNLFQHNRTPLKMSQIDNNSKILWSNLKGKLIQDKLYLCDQCLNNTKQQVKLNLTAIKIFK